MTSIRLTEYQVWQEPVGDSGMFGEKLLSKTYCKEDAEEDRYLLDRDDPAPDKSDFRRIVIREVEVTISVVGYRAGLDRNPRTYDWRPKASHTYAMMSDDSLLPMCGYGWNRSDGHRFSILRQLPGSQGSCKLCAKNVAAGKPPLIDGFPHKTRWI